MDHSPKPTPILLWLGTALIVLSIVVLLFSSWNQSGPLLRTISACIPTILLYALAFWSRKQGHQPVAAAAFVAGALAFPLTLGVVIYQSGVYSYFDATLVFAVSLASLLWYLFVDTLLGTYWHAPAIVIASVTAAISFSSLVNAQPWVTTILVLLLAYFFIIASFSSTIHKQSPAMASAYLIGGSLLGLYGLASAPINFLSNTKFDTNVSLHLIGYALVALKAWAIAWLLGKAWQQSGRIDQLYARQLFENTGLMLYIWPLISLGVFYTEQGGNLVLASLLVATLGVAVGVFFHLRALRVASLIVAIIAILRILTDSFSESSAYWPILFLVVGSGLIGLYFFQQRMQKNEGTHPSNPLGLWIAPAKPATGPNMYERFAVIASLGAFILVAGFCSLFLSSLHTYNW